jgi:hypothetical protein
VAATRAKKHKNFQLSTLAENHLSHDFPVVEAAPWACPGRPLFKVAAK